MNIREIEKDLLKVSFFNELGNLEIKEIAAKFSQIHVDKGEYIFLEGDVGDSFYVVKCGSLEIIKQSHSLEKSGAELHIVSAFDFFGEMSLIDEHPRSASVLAIEDSVLYKLEKGKFLQICDDYPNILLQLSKILSMRIRFTNEKFITLWDELWKKSRMEALGVAASRIVHDIKNPVTVIVLAAQLIEKKYPEAQKYATDIIKQTNSLDKMVKELLDFSKGEQSTLDCSDTKIEPVFRALHKEINNFAMTKNVQLMLVNKAHSLLHLDFDRVKRLLVNLVRNGIEASPAGGKVRVFASVENRLLKITVCDEGAGIDSDLFDSIFDPFVTRDKKGGTGLGLAICRKIAEDHNGWLKAENREPSGAKFSVYLPVISN